jgi:hypothetical protein
LCYNGGQGLTSEKGNEEVPLSNNQIRLWIILSILMGGLTLTPFALLGLLCIGVPLLVLKLAHVNRWVFGGTVAATLAIPALFLGTAGWPILMWMFFIILPINWMLSGYKRSTSAKLPLTYGTIGILVVFFLIMITGMNVYPQGWTHFVADIKSQMINSNEQLKLGMSQKEIARFANQAIQIIPTVFVLLSIGIAGFMHTIVRRVFRRNRILLPELRIADEWRVPKSWVVLFTVAFISQSIFEVGDSSFMALAVHNLVPLLMVALSVQAFGFLHVMSRTKKWANALKVVAAILVLPLTLLVVIIGIIDVLTPLRERFVKQEG